MHQGEIWYANLNPVSGSEQAGKRPVVIISGDTMNHTLPIVIVVPISSAVKAYPTCVLLHANTSTGIKQDSEAIPFQVRALAKSRLTKLLGRVTEADLRDIQKGLFLVLTH